MTDFSKISVVNSHCVTVNKSTFVSIGAYCRLRQPCLALPYSAFPAMSAVTHTLYVVALASWETDLKFLGCTLQMWKWQSLPALLPHLLSRHRITMHQMLNIEVANTAPHILLTQVTSPVGGPMTGTSAGSCHCLSGPRFGTTLYASLPAHQLLRLAAAPQR